MKVVINGLGRIGRQVLKIALEKGVNVVAVNDLTSVENLAYLLKYDSVYGRYDKNVEAGQGFLRIGGKKISIFAEPEPEKLPWKKLGVDIVVESTGVFDDKIGASKHLRAGAKRVVISAPAKEVDVTVVLGVNEKSIKKSDKIISMASCTTNCLAPLAKVLNDEFGIKRGFMNTIHGYTGSQNIVDGPHKKVRRGRAGAQNIVPTTSGATKATIKVLPELKGKLDGLAMRVPVISGSIVDFTAELEKGTNVKGVNDALKKAGSGNLKGILEYSEEELVSTDIIGHPCSCIVDGLSTQVLGNNLVKVLAWYDNEFGYSMRMVELLKRL